MLGELGEVQGFKTGYISKVGIYWRLLKKRGQVMYYTKALLAAWCRKGLK